jgi:DNA-directed RNA polymerase II subunit RPB1
VSSASHTLFFSQGISAKNVTLGVPRLNEILNVAKNIKTPSVTINIRKADDEEEASDLISQVRESSYAWNVSDEDYDLS